MESMDTRQKEVLWAVEELEREGELNLDVDLVAFHMDKEPNDIGTEILSLMANGYLSKTGELGEYVTFGTTIHGKAWLEYHVKGEDNDEDYS